MIDKNGIRYFISFMIISNVKKYRKKRRLNKNLLAELCGVDRKTINRAEIIEPHITLRNAMSIAQVLQVPINKLFINKRIGTYDMLKMMEGK